MIIRGQNETFEVEIGDKVRLQYNGYPEVPKFMSGDIVTIIGFARVKVKVQWHEHVLHVREDQLRPMLC